MAIRKVLRIGDLQLRRHAGAVDRFGDAALGTLITDMLDTMKACDGAGLAMNASMLFCPILAETS